MGKTPTTTEIKGSLIPLSAVEAAVGYSARTIARRVKSGQFPRPIKLGSACRKVLFRKADIEEYLRAL